MHSPGKRTKSATLEMHIITYRDMSIARCDDPLAIIPNVENCMKPTVGMRLKELRAARKLSQEQVAQMTGVAQNTVSLYEGDLRQPPYDMLISFARVYHSTTDYILGLDDRRSITVDGRTEPEIEVVITLVTLMAEKNKLINGI